MITVRQILAWARAHRKQTGKRPSQHSGDIPEAPGQTWLKIDRALRLGARGRPRSSLSQLLNARLR